MKSLNEKLGKKEKAKVLVRTKGIRTINDTCKFYERLTRLIKETDFEIMSQNWYRIDISDIYSIFIWVFYDNKYSKQIGISIDYHFYQPKEFRKKSENFPGSRGRL
jgi:hypothetical protein